MSTVPAATDTRMLALATLGTMTATVAHEVRNLLGGIELYASLVAEQCAGEPDLAPLTGRLLGGVKRLHAVAANILAVARRPAAERSPVDLVRLVAEVTDGAVLTVRDTGVRLAVRSTIPKAWVRGDAEQLRQALLNLVLNAVQAMPDGGTLTVSTRLVDGGRRCELAVADTGVGMDEATSARVFEPFFTTRPHGTGLGLAVVHEVATAHAAVITLRSRPGRGTTFRLAFPLDGEGL